MIITKEQPVSNYTEFAGVDEREAAVIKDPTQFFELYKGDTKSLFTALNRMGEWSDDPNDMLPYMRSGWIGNEHGNSTEKDQFTQEETDAAMPILAHMGLTTELLPNPGEHFDQVVIVGGTMVANKRRIDLVKRALADGVEMDKVIFWVGQRPREARDGTNDELMSIEGRFAGEDVETNTWVQRKLANGSFEAANKWGLTETDLGRLAVNKVFGGDLQPYRIDLKVTDSNDPEQHLPQKLDGVPTRDITDYRFKTPEGQEIILMNAAAVKRGDAPARHTTRSCTEEWEKRFVPEEGARVLYITGNPHSIRTTQDTYKVLQDLGRTNVELVVAGTAPAEGTPIQSFLGEVARLIDNGSRVSVSV